MSEMDCYGMSDYEYSDETPEPETIEMSYAVSVENLAGLSERFGSRRAEYIREFHPMVEVTAIDRGGPYVDIYLFGSAVAGINTWDYAKGARREPFTRDGVHALIMQWVEEDLMDYLGEYT